MTQRVKSLALLACLAFGPLAFSGCYYHDYDHRHRRHWDDRWDRRDWDDRDWDHHGDWDHRGDWDDHDGDRHDWDGGDRSDRR